MLRDIIVLAWEWVKVGIVLCPPSEAKKHGVLNTSLTLRHYGDYGDPLTVNLDGSITKVTNEEVGQGLGQIRVANPDTSTSAVGCLLPHWAASSPTSYLL